MTERTLSGVHSVPTCREEEVDWSTLTVAPTAFDAADAESLAGYPELDFCRTGAAEMKAYRLVVMENDYLQATFCPSLGGRLVAYYDKDSGEDLLPRILGVATEADGSWAHGIQFRPTRARGAGPVQFLLESDEDSAVFQFWGSGEGLPVDWDVRVELARDEAALRIRQTVRNRCLEPVGTCLGVSGVDGRLAAGAQVAGVPLEAAPGRLEPLQVQERSLWIAPSVTLGPPLSFSGGVQFSLAEDSLSIRSIANLSGKVVLLTPGGEVLESPVTLKGGRTEVFPLPGKDLARVALLDVEGRVIHDAMTTSRTEAPLVLPDWQGFLQDASDGTALGRYLMSPVYEAAACTVLARRASSAGDYAAADEWLERAIGANANSAMLWWFKAAVRREGGLCEDGVESPENMNAHFLTPHEPLLRAEAFLAQGSGQAKGPNPLLAPLAEDPSSAVEVVCRYLEAGLRENAMRVGDAILKHRDIPNLRYVMADQLLTHSRMQATAAEFVAACERAPLEPPFPWRPLERAAIGRLAKKFPDMGRLKSLQQLLDATATQGK